MNTVSWRCYPPYVDAYVDSPYDCGRPYNDQPYDNTCLSKAKKDLQDATLKLAYQWGTKSIGEQCVKEGEPAKFQDAHVLAVGELSYGGKTTQFALVLEQSDKEEWSTFIEHAYPSQWNVT